MNKVKKCGLTVLLVVNALCAQVLQVCADELVKGFQDPSDEYKPSCYWYWLNGDISKDGITKDLETMAKVGIRRAMIGNIEGGGPVKMCSQDWYDLTHHALKEAARVGVDIMMFNAPGWSQSGGPWIKPEPTAGRSLRLSVRPASPAARTSPVSRCRKGRRCPFMPRRTRTEFCASGTRSRSRRGRWL